MEMQNMNNKSSSSHKNELSTVSAVKIKNDARGLTLKQTPPYVYDLFYGIIGIINREIDKNRIIQITGKEAYECGILPRHIYKKGAPAISETFNKLNELSNVTLLTMKNGHTHFSRQYLFSGYDIDTDPETNNVVYKLKINEDNRYLFRIIASQGFFRIVYNTEKSLSTVYQKEFYKLLCSERTKGVLQISDREFRLLLGLDKINSDPSVMTGEVNTKTIKASKHRSQTIVERIVNPTIENENVKKEFADLQCVQVGNKRQDWIFKFKKQDQAKMDTNPEYRKQNLMLAEYLIPEDIVNNSKKVIFETDSNEASAMEVYYETLDTALRETKSLAPIYKKYRELFHEYSKKLPNVPVLIIDMFVKQPIKSISALESLTMLAVYLDQKFYPIPEQEVIKLYTQAAVQFSLNDPSDCITLYNLVNSTPSDEFKGILKKVTRYGNSGSVSELKDELAKLRYAKLEQENAAIREAQEKAHADLFNKVLPDIPYDVNLSQKINDYVEYMNSLSGNFVLMTLRAQLSRLMMNLSSDVEPNSYIINLMDDAMFHGTSIIDLHPELFTNPTAVKKKQESCSEKNEYTPNQKIEKRGLSKDKAIKEKAEELLKYLNQICHTSYSNCKQFINPIISTLKKGKSESEIRKVIRQAGIEWGNEVMCGHLNPEEIFKENRFEKFLGGADPTSFTKQRYSHNDPSQAKFPDWYYQSDNEKPASQEEIRAVQDYFDKLTNKAQTQRDQEEQLVTESDDLPF